MCYREERMDCSAASRKHFVLIVEVDYPIGTAQLNHVCAYSGSSEVSRNDVMVLKGIRCWSI